MIFLVAFLASGDTLGGKLTDPAPRGIHTSLDGSDSLRIMWSTASTMTSPAQCQFGQTNVTLDQTAVGRSYTYPFEDGGFTGRLHEVILRNLTFKTVFYRCGGEGALSSLLKIDLQPTSVSEPGSAHAWIGVIGDMGIEESEHTIAGLKSAVSGGDMQLLVHVGDISYANDYKPPSNNSWVWDKYMDMIELITSRVPYMTSPGNHEAQFNFSAYLNRLHMPYVASGSPSPFYHSFDYLGVHFTMFSTEHDFSNGSVQQKWIESDLKKASQNREQVPWIVVIGHRPLYCSSIAVIDRCDKEAPVYRDDIEWLLQMYRTDVYICGHNHQYERSYPVYNNTVTSHEYTNPQAPVHIVNGAAGDLEHIDPTFLPEFLVPWRAAHGHLRETSWLRMTPDAKNLKIELIRSSTNEVQDSFTITKD